MLKARFVSSQEHVHKDNAPPSK